MDGCPKAGLGVVGGKGLASPCPLPPAAQATQLGCRAEAANLCGKCLCVQAKLPMHAPSFFVVTLPTYSHCGGPLGESPFVSAAIQRNVLKPAYSCHPACRRQRVMARRRSPPRRGGSSDAARTLVPSPARDSGRATPYDARQRGEQGRAAASLIPVRDGCPKTGMGVVGGKGRL